MEHSTNTVWRMEGNSGPGVWWQGGAQSRATTVQTGKST